MDYTYELHNGDDTVSYMSKEVAESLKVIAQICYGERNCAACPWRIKDDWCLFDLEPSEWGKYIYVDGRRLDVSLDKISANVRVEGGMRQHDDT